MPYPKRILDVDVTQADIDAARDRPHHDRTSPWCCPLGRAIARAVGLDPAYGEIDVDPRWLYLADRSGRLRKAAGRLPRVARRFIEDYDAGRPVRPIRFRMAIRDLRAGPHP